MDVLGEMTEFHCCIVVNLPKVYELWTNRAMKGHKGGCWVQLPGPLRKARLAGLFLALDPLSA
jgi:hypothetical protein